MWSITVTFSHSESESFTIFQGGICRLGDDYETNHILRGGADIYNEFLSYFKEAQKSESADGSLDVVTAMRNVKANDFTNSDYYGNVTADELSQALNAAAANQIGAADEVSAGYLEGVYPYWSIEDAYIEGGPDSWSSTDLHFRIDCGLTENTVEVSIRKDNRRDTAYFEDAALYQLVRHHGDYDEVVDEPAYEKFKDTLVPQMDKVYAMMSDKPGSFTGYQLTRFALAWSYDNQSDGSKVELYYFNYALLTDDPTAVGWAGGMYLDSKLRVQGFNGGGQFAVKYSGGEIVSTVFMDNDFYYSPEYVDDAKWAMGRLNSALNTAAS
ncbi:MAG: hypothetical protein AB7C97_09925 [Oscillospiraceae bacterium]